MISCTRPRRNRPAQVRNTWRPSAPTSVFAIEVLWLVSRRKLSTSESSIVSSRCLLRPGRTTATSLRRISHTRFRPIHSLLQHLPSRPVGFQQLSHLLRRFLAQSQTIGHLHHLLKQHCNLLFHNSVLPTRMRTHQNSISRSSDRASSVLSSFSGHDEFSWPVSLETYQLCPFNARATVLNQPRSDQAHATMWNEYDSGNPFLSRYWTRL